MEKSNAVSIETAPTNVQKILLEMNEIQCLQTQAYFDEDAILKTRAFQKDREAFYQSVTSQKFQNKTLEDLLKSLEKKQKLTLTFLHHLNHYEDLKEESVLKKTGEPYANLLNGFNGGLLECVMISNHLLSLFRETTPLETLPIETLKELSQTFEYPLKMLENETNYIKETNDYTKEDIKQYSPIDQMIFGDVNDYTHQPLPKIPEEENLKKQIKEIYKIRVKKKDPETLEVQEYNKNKNLILESKNPEYTNVFLTLVLKNFSQDLIQEAFHLAQVSELKESVLEWLDKIPNHLNNSENINPNQEINFCLELYAQALKICDTNGSCKPLIQRVGKIKKPTQELLKELSQVAFLIGLKSKAPEDKAGEISTKLSDLVGKYSPQEKVE